MQANTKTIFICHNYSDDSFASGSKYLAEYLSAQGYKLVFLSHRPRGLQAIVDGNLTVLPWPVKKRPTTLKAAWFFINTYFRHKPDFVIGHFGGAILSSVLSKVLSFGKVKVFNVYHTLSWQNKLDANQSRVLYSLQNLRRRLFYKWFVDEIIAPSKAAKTDYLDNWPAKPLHIVYNGYKTRETDKDINMAFHKKELLFLGRLDASKGVQQLIEAFTHYTTNNPHSKLSLRLVGQVPKGMFSGVNNTRTKFDGVATYDKIPGIISDAYFLITPSLIDNLPTVGIEALSYHTPVVASTKGGWPEIINDKVNGFLIEPQVEDIISILARLDKLTLDEYNTLCTNARKKYEAQFTPAHYANTIAKTLE